MKLNRLFNKFKVSIGNVLIKFTYFLYKLSKIHFVGKFLFGFYKGLLRLINIAILPIVNAKVYKESTDKVCIFNIETRRLGVMANTVFAGSHEKIKLIEHSLPDLRLKKFKDVYIQGGSDVVVDIDNELVISEEAYNIDDDLQIIDGLMYREKGNVCLLRNNLRCKKISIESGIMISGNFPRNYYHVLYENFIKLLYVKDTSIPKGIPIIVDSATMMIPSCKVILEILTKQLKRKIIPIESRGLYHFNDLFCIDHVNHLSANLMKFQKTFDTYYSQNALKTLREKLLQYKSLKSFPPRIFISRCSTKRRRFNENEVYDILAALGFVRISPELFTFEEQMSLFNGAEFIVAGSGAALSNLLFTTSKCKVICFGKSSYDRDPAHEMPIFNTIANINGASFFYFPRKKEVTSDIHSDFEIDCILLEQEIKKFLRN